MWFGVIGDEARAEQEIHEAENVGSEDEEEHDVETSLPRLGVARCVLLRGEGGVEGLVFAGVEDVGFVLPKVVEGGGGRAEQ